MYIPTLSKLLSTLIIAIGTIAQAYSQPDVSQVSVSASLLKKHVYLLASDSLRGRETGTQGQHEAAIYCIRMFRQSHLLSAFRIDSLRGSSRQTYPFTTTDVVKFGLAPTNGTAPPTYKHYELAPLPLTSKDSSHVSFGDNVGGLIMGTDLKKEVVVISAHYDHLGHSGKSIYHGADDNASGAATVLGVTAVFDSLAQEGIRPRRSILFVLFSGEEEGLLGSKYFVNNSPIPLNQIVCDLNIDMVGRIDDDHRKRPNYCYLIDGNQDNALQETARIANQLSVNLTLNKGGYDTQNDPKQYFYRSDQYNFAKLGIPVLFFTSGEHPDYHKSSDTADKIEYDVLQKRATLVFQTAWLVANQ